MVGVEDEQHVEGLGQHRVLPLHVLSQLDIIRRKLAVKSIVLSGQTKGMPSLKR